MYMNLNSLNPQSARRRDGRRIFGGGVRRLIAVWRRVYLDSLSTYLSMKFNIANCSRLLKKEVTNGFIHSFISPFAADR